MISVEPRKSSLVVSGHAGYAESGKDIVCAGISALTNTLVESLDRLTEDKVSSATQKGQVIITWDNLSDKGELLISSFLIGVKDFESEYPQYVKIV